MGFRRHAARFRPLTPLAVARIAVALVVGRAGTRQGVWMRLMFDTPEIPVDGWSMLLNRLPTGGTIYLNGKMVADLPLDSEHVMFAGAARI